MKLHIPIDDKFKGETIKLDQNTIRNKKIQAPLSLVLGIDI